MKNLKLIGLWLLTLVTFELIGEVISRPINGWLQLLCVLGWIGLFSYSAITTKNKFLNDEN